MTVFRGTPEIDLTLEMIFISDKKRVELKPNLRVSKEISFVYSYPVAADRLTFIGRDKSGVRYTFTLIKVE